MKQLIFLLLCFPFLSFSQDALETELDSISSIEEAKTFAKTHKKTNKSKVFTFNKEKHKTRLADELFKLSNQSIYAWLVNFHIIKAQIY